MVSSLSHAPAVRCAVRVGLQECEGLRQHVAALQADASAADERARAAQAALQAQVVSHQATIEQLMLENVELAGRVNAQVNVMMDLQAQVAHSRQAAGGGWCFRVKLSQRAGPSSCCC